MVNFQVKCKNPCCVHLNLDKGCHLVSDWLTLNSFFYLTTTYLAWPFQRRWQFWSDPCHEGHPVVERPCRVEAPGHLQIFLRDRRRVFPLRRADLCHEIRVLDLWRVSGGFAVDGGTRTWSVLRSASTDGLLCKTGRLCRDSNARRRLSWCRHGFRSFARLLVLKKSVRLTKCRHLLKPVVDFFSKCL